MNARRTPHLLLPCLAVVVGGCSGGGSGGSNDLTDEENVATVLEHFEPALAKITAAGLEAKGVGGSGANINPIVVPGDEDGDLTLGGTVAVSTGQNEQLNLWVALGAYSGTGDVTYATGSTASALGFSLNINNTPPDNTMTGDLDGELSVAGLVTGTGIFRRD